MTGRDAEREQLAAALEQALDAAYHYSSYRWPQQEDCPRIAAALLPTVDRIANERAAAELRAVACEAMETTPGAHRVHVPVSDLFDRAAALLASNGAGTTT